MSAKKRSRVKNWLAVFGLVAWVLVAMFGAAVVVGLVLGWLESAGWPIDEENPLTVMILDVVIYVLALVVTVFGPWLVLRKSMKTTRDEMGLRGWLTWMDILLGVGGFVVSALVGGLAIIGLSAVLPGVNWEQEQDVGFNNIYLTGDLIKAFVALVVVAPICEELIFRGWLYGKLRARIAVAPAVIIVSLLFALVHGQMNVGVVVFFMSVANCLIRELTGTIYGGWIVHVTRNALAFASMFSWML